MRQQIKISNIWLIERYFCRIIQSLGRRAILWHRFITRRVCSVYAKEINDTRVLYDRRGIEQKNNNLDHETRSKYNVVKRFKEVDGERTSERHMIDIMEFMAIDVLRGVEHIYKHDLESFFYVLLWICARRAWKIEFHCKRKDRPTNSVLRNWYEDTNKKVAKMKQNFMHVDGFDDILMKFASVFDCTKPLCKDLRNILFLFTEIGRLNFGISVDAKTLYEFIIKVFEDAITGLDTDT